MAAVRKSLQKASGLKTRATSKTEGVAVEFTVAPLLIAGGGNQAGSREWHRER
jgi:hypothetical protein